MGFDIQMNEPPTAAEVQRAHLDADQPGYFRFNWSAMPVMVVTMAWAGAVVEEKPPAWPAWPPEGTPADHRDLLMEAVSDPKREPELTVPERKATIAIRARFERLRATRSARPGKVPAYKFASNDGFIVTAAESAIIAAKLRTYAKQLTPAKLAALDKVYRDAQQPLLDDAKQRGETVLLGNEGLGLTLDDYRGWILQWAAYNEVASHHRGYRIE